jgi:hypothetical protein
MQVEDDRWKIIARSAYGIVEKEFVKIHPLPRQRGQGVDFTYPASRKCILHLVYTAERLRYCRK